MKHSQIFMPNTKPVNAGYYPATDWNLDELEKLRNGSNLLAVKNSIYWWYWSGFDWREYEHSAGPCLCQERYWFGRLEQ